jgi:CarboxypepD_reg-like domain
MTAGGRRASTTVWIFVWLSTSAWGQALQKPAVQDLTPGVIVGRVVDAGTGTALSRVVVLEERTGQSVMTDGEGRFELTVPPGPGRLRVSVVGFVLVRREVDVAPGGRAEVTIPVTGGTGTYSETVTVKADAFRRGDSVSPAQQALDSADIQNLRGVLADDPLRAVQSLSGAATGDDLRSEFSIRGTDFSHLDFTVDGFSTPFLLHTVRAVEDHSNSGSVAMVNSDVLQGVVVENGGYPQRTGNRTGASVAFRLREGSRDRTELRGAVSGTSMSTVGEGPLGRGRRGSWLLSARYSYLDRLIDRLSDDGFTFGFSDVQGKVVFDLTPRQTLDVAVIAGRSRLAQPVDNVDSDDLFAGRNASALAMSTWRLTGRRGLVSAGVLGSTNTFRNDTLDEIVLDRGTDGQVTTRVDAQYQWSPHGQHLQVEAGGIVDWANEMRVRQRFVAGALTVVNDYAGDATRAGGFAVVRWRPLRKFSIAPGVRVDRWTVVRSAEASPWLQAEWRIAAPVTVRGGVGLYRQAPELEQVIGAWSATDPQLERSSQFDLGVEWRPGASTRVQVTLFDRQDDDYMRRAGAETRVVSGRLVRASPAARYANRLDGFARGVEVLAQLRNPNGLSGWISYAYGRNQYHDEVSDETFWGNLDQRHTFNAYAGYRLTAKTSLSAKLRMGSNFPAPGYYAESGGTFFVIDRKNEVRLPVYARLDLRANRTFGWSRHRLTLFAEVINVLDRANVRYSPPSIDSRTREARHLYESMIPIVPSAGVLIEF